MLRWLLFGQVLLHDEAHSQAIDLAEALADFRILTFALALVGDTVQ